VINLELLRTSINLLTPKEQFGALLIVVSMTITGFLESAVAALIIPVVYVLTDPAVLETSQIGRAVIAISGFPARDTFPALIAALVTLLLLSAALTIANLYFSERHSAACATRTSTELISRIIRAPYSWTQTQNTQRLLNSVYEDVRIWRKTNIDSILGAVQSAILIAFPTAVVIVISPAKGRWF
jgi:ABC-type multidrug transport system fused ATPase/permease subunit